MKWKTAAKQVQKQILTPFNLPFHHSKLPSVKTYFFKGHEHHYDYLQKQVNKSINHEDQVYCLDIESVDLALEMALRQKQMLTMISSVRYDTVEIAERTKGLQSINTTMNSKKFELFFKNDPTQKKLQRQDIQNTALYILKYYKFITKSTFLDVHPLHSYKRMSSYLLQKALLNKKPIKEYFQPCKFTDQVISNSFQLLPLQSQLRTKYLITDKLKLQWLQRKQNCLITSEDINKYVNRWKDIIQFSVLQAATSSSIKRNEKMDFAVRNDLGQIATVRQILAGKYQHYHYSTWY